MQPALILLLPAFLLGLVATTQIQSQGRRSLIPSPYTSQDSVKLTEVALQLQRDQTKLKGELVGLRARLAELQAQGAAMGGEAAALQAQLDQLREEAGLTPLSGARIGAPLGGARLPPPLDPPPLASANGHPE